MIKKLIDRFKKRQKRLEDEYNYTSTHNPISNGSYIPSPPAISPNSFSSGNPAISGCFVAVEIHEEEFDAPSNRILDILKDREEVYGDD